LTSALDVKGKTILIYDEQGLGDTILFVRYLPLLLEKGAKVLLAPQPSLRQLLHTLGPGVRIVSLVDTTLEFDFHTPLASLPLAFGTEADNIPVPIPYLKAEPDRVSFWRSKLGDNGFKIGICWQGSTHKIDRGRSFPLALFHDLAKIEGVRLVSLHKGAGESQLENLPNGMVVEKLGEDFDTGDQAFLDSAAVINCCDLVITSDTAIAHLAGALGASTWVVLKWVPDWRWQLERKDSPWYPSLQLFRQSQPGQWQPVFVEMENSLRSLMQGRKA
jgi:hypothetical protein